MSSKPLYESTLSIKKIVSKKEATNDGKLSNAISEAIQCLVNSDNSKSKHISVNISINVASVEIEGKEGNNVVKTVSKEPPAIESEKFVNKVKIIDTSDSTKNNIHKLVHLEEPELSRNTPITNLKKKRKRVQRLNKNANNSGQPKAMKNKLVNKNGKVKGCEVAKTDEQCLNQLNVALEQLLKYRLVCEQVMPKRFEMMKKYQMKPKKKMNTNNAPNSAKCHLKTVKKRKTKEV